MSSNAEIANFLDDVLKDWRKNRGEFPHNTYPENQWPIPFFGNPVSALVATVGVNPSSIEFSSNRNWIAVQADTDWHQRLEHYFTGSIPAYNWFDPWRSGLPLLNISYETDTVAHFDVSYRSTIAMFDNPETDSEEFRRMVEQDIAWFFRLLHLCPKLRGLLVFGKILRDNGTRESLAGFIRRSAPRHGFSVLPDGGICHESNGQLPKNLFLHDVSAPGAGTITDQVVANLTQHRAELLKKIHRNE